MRGQVAGPGGTGRRLLVMVQSMEDTHEVHFGSFRLDLASERLWRGTEAVRLRPKSFAVLRYLAEHPGRVVTKDEIMQGRCGPLPLSCPGSPRRSRRCWSGRKRRAPSSRGGWRRRGAACGRWGS